MQNRKDFMLSFFIFLFIPIAFSYSYYNPSYPGSVTNPLQVEIVPSPSQIYQQSLKDQAERLNQKYQDINQASLLEQQRKLNQELLDSTREQQQNQRLNEILKQSQIISSPNLIQNKKTVIITPVINNQQNTKNTVVPDIERYNQVCKTDYGTNSIWSMRFNENGGPICDCYDGYNWNKEGTLCLSVVTDAASSKVETTSNNNVITTAVESQHKSIWEKIKGWFGY